MGEWGARSRLFVRDWKRAVQPALQFDVLMSLIYAEITTSPDFGKFSEKSGLIVSAPWYIRSQNPSDFERDNKNLWEQNSIIDWETVMTYDATQAIIEALNKMEKTPTRQELREYLLSNIQTFSAEGATAKVQFATNGSRRVESSNPNDRLGVLVKVKCNGSSCNFVDANTQ